MVRNPGIRFDGCDEETWRRGVFLIGYSCNFFHSAESEEIREAARRQNAWKRRIPFALFLLFPYLFFCEWRVDECRIKSAAGVLAPFGVTMVFLCYLMAPGF